MSFKIVWSLFLTGLVLGYGPCLLSCGPLLVSYISATQRGPGQGLKIYAVFSLTRIIVYALFGILVGLFGEHVLHRFFESLFLDWLFFSFGAFLILLAILLLLHKLPTGQACHRFVGRCVEGGVKNAIVFSLVVSLAPCLPLLGIMGYIALISDTWTKGVLFMVAFGLGTIISPMILFSAAAGWLAKISRRFEFWFMALRLLCCVVLVWLGVQLLLFRPTLPFYE